jgi:hypothetical protein
VDTTEVDATVVAELIEDARTNPNCHIDLMNRCAIHRIMAEGVPPQLDIGWSEWHLNGDICLSWHIVGGSAVEAVDVQTRRGQ